MINNEQGEFYNVFAERVNRYLRKKAVEIIHAGANVILDWGFWTRESRIEISEFFKLNNVQYEWHYIDVDEKTWYQNIEKRNNVIKSGKKGSDFYVDERLLNNLLDSFEKPSKEEIDVWYVLSRY